MGDPKKKDIADPVNDKIQGKFDLIFGHAGSASANLENVQSDGDSSMSGSAQKKTLTEMSSPNLDLNFDESTEIEFESSASSATSATVAISDPLKTKSPQALAVVPDDNGLDFALDFTDNSSSESSDMTSLSQTGQGINLPPIETSEIHEAQDLDKTTFNNDLDTMFDSAIEEAASSVADGTQKTILFDINQLSGTSSFGVETSDNTNSSAELMSTEEEKANIESTIKDILRPKNLDSVELSELSSTNNDHEVENLDDEIVDVSLPGFNFQHTPAESSQTGEFDLSSVDFADHDSLEDIVTEKVIEVAPVKKMEVASSFNSIAPNNIAGQGHSSYISDEESGRVQATIRQLREEREGLLEQVKILKGGHRELEQDNLTLNAALDESKIEVSILRKRHMVEVDDLKYRLSFNEEKKAMAEAKSRQAEIKIEKLEQRVRIDFNQVKQREKELETKLEMLTLDVDSQVQTREQKILELRRKIDSLEFNMENVSIKEQKSQDDKRRLEDKLNKIMKTLRHSIKNIEDDVEISTDDSSDNNQNANHRFGKA
ncbi:MAG: hypothetical protein Q7U04_02285 [Bacteriovorax sp.]|nr:hypothetical protein [Bacteriovorax sp.]